MNAMQTDETRLWNDRANDLALALGVANDHIDALQDRNAGLVAALQSVELQLTQARIASNIGRGPSVKKADFLRGQCERIAQDVRAALQSAKE